MLSLKCAILIFSIVFLSASAEFSTKFWGEELTPRLKVNYLSQSNGKNNFLTFLLHFKTLILVYSQVPIKRVGPNKRVGWNFINIASGSEANMTTLCEIEFFDFLWLILVHYLPLPPT